MNHIVLIGRAVRDSELRYTPNGVAVANFDLAVDRPTKNQNGEKEVDFIKIITWQKTAELCGEYVKKGRLLAVEGRLQIRSYTTQDGQKRTVAEVVASFVQFLDKANNEGSVPATSNKAPQQQEDFGGVNLDDLPF